MTLSADQYVFPYRTADGQVVPLVFQRKPENGRFAIPVRSADGKTMVAGLGPLNDLDQHGIPTLASDGQVAGMHGGLGKLFVGGDFSLAGSVPAQSIARRDPSSWFAPSPVTVGGCWDGMVFNAELVVTGDFTQIGGIAAGGIAKWDGAAWSVLGSGLAGGSARGLVMALFSGALVVGGEFETAGGLTAWGIAQWDGTTWSDLDGGLSLFTGPAAGVGANLIVWNNDLVVAGFFDRAGSVDAQRIAKWNGAAWSTIGADEINGIPSALGEYAGSLILGTSSIMLGGVPHFIAKWSGTAWSVMGAGLNGAPRAFVQWDGDLIVGGNFSASGAVSLPEMAKWDGSAWSPFGSRNWTLVDDLAVIDDQLYAVGSGSPDGTGLFLWTGSEWARVGDTLNDLVRMVVEYEPAP
ncbi:MAG: hypothetical protein GY778_13695 [bacterium]|nr:hypothetical protein [bacterium]